MNEPHPTSIVLTPEQRAALGRVYRLILSWRRQRLQREAETSAMTMEQPKPKPVPADSESEA